MANQLALDITYALVFVIATSLISVVWYRMSLLGVKAFIAMQLGVTFYAFGMFMEINSDMLDMKVLWNNIQVVSLGVIMATFPLFAITYAGRRTKRTYLFLTPLWAFLAITLVVLWTNPWHHLYYLSFDLRESLDFILLGKEYGPWAMATVGVAFLTLVFGTLYVWRASKNWPAEKRQQSLVMMLAFVIPPIMGLFYVFLSVQIVDLVLFGFLISGIIVFVALYRFNLFELLPMADTLIFQSMEDAIIVSDTKGTIVQANPSAATLIGRRADEVVGWTSLQYLEGLGLQINKDLSSKWEAEVEASTGAGKKSLELRNSPIDIPRRGVKGNLIIIRDMTPKRKAETQARIASDKLHILDSMTRHGIMNQSMAIAGPLF